MSCLLRQRPFQLLVGALAVLVSLVGCRADTRRGVLEFLFEDDAMHDSPAAAVVRSPRHPPPATATPTAAPQDPARAGSAASGPDAFVTFDDVARKLPKDAVGNPDWMRALMEKVVQPKPGLSPEAKEQDLLDLDVELVPPSNPTFRVVFSHRKHGQWLSCANCHDSIFEMKSGDALPWQDVHRTRYCATCHGSVAFDTRTGCPLCHLQALPKDPNGRVDWSRALDNNLIAPLPSRHAKAEALPELDLDVIRESPGQPTFRSIFPHSSHTRLMSCDNCHPRLFPMAKVEGVKPEELHSRRYCGSCHGSVAFPINSACRPCHPSFEQARHHEASLDLDVPLRGASGSDTGQVFSHKTHRYLACANCHNNLYDPSLGAGKLGLTDLAGGKHCATCHGKVAGELMAQCQRCHAELEDGH